MAQLENAGIHEVEIEYATMDGHECEYEYKRSRTGTEKGEVETRSPGENKIKRNDNESLQEVKRIVGALSIHPDVNSEELIDSTCRILNLDRKNLRKLEIEIEFDSGKEIKARLH